MAMAGVHRIAGGAAVVARLGCLVPERLCQGLLAPAGDAFQPGDDLAVRLAPATPRDAGVGDVPDEDVVEDELPFAGDGRRLALADEAFVEELGQRRQGGRPSQPRDGTGPEDPADDGSVLDDSLVLVRQEIEPRSDDALDRVGQVRRQRPGQRPAIGVVSKRPVLHDHPEQLADEERVAVGAVEQRPDDHPRRRPAEQLLDEGLAFLGRQASEGDRGRIR